MEDHAFEDPVLVAIAEQARALTKGHCAMHVQGAGSEAVLVIELPPTSIVRGRLLNKRLAAFCKKRGLARRYLVVGSTTPQFVSKPQIPEGWPPPGGESSAEGSP